MAGKFASSPSVFQAATTTATTRIGVENIFGLIQQATTESSAAAIFREEPFGENERNSQDWSSSFERPGTKTERLAVSVEE